MYWIISVSIGFFIFFIGILIRFFHIFHVLEDHSNWDTIRQIKNDQAFQHTLGNFIILLGILIMPLVRLSQLNFTWLIFNILVLILLILSYVIRFTLWDHEEEK